MQITMLYSLPDELLAEIVMNLPWNDILRLRQTCKRLQDVTRSHEVWRSFVHEESRQAFWLELPVESYTSEELERLILRRKSADLRYEKGADDIDDDLVLSRRILPIKLNLPSDSVSLIPGGRWLLISTSSGSVNYYDLTSENCIRKELIPKGFTNNLRRISSMCVDMDSDSPTLKFNLALATVDHTRYHNRQATIEIWNVDLVVDDKGKAVGLAAQLLVGFMQEPYGNIESMALVGNHFAYSIPSGLEGEVYAFIVDWKTIKDINYTKRVLRIIPATALCLFNGYICVPIERDLYLFSLTSLIEITVMPPGTLISNPPPVATVSLYKIIEASTISHSISKAWGTHVIAETFDGLYDITVKMDQSVPILESKKIADLRHSSYLVDARVSISDNFCLAWTSDGTTLLKRVWQSDGHCSPKSPPSLPLPHISPGQPYFYCLDMASGQVIAYEEGSFTILYLRSC